MKLALDAFCNAGGATRGYQLAGWYVIGVDNKPQPDYCGDEFVLGDAVKFIRDHGHEFGLRHASPPCQRFSTITADNDSHPDYVAATREALGLSSAPWVIENVMNAPLRKDLMLCGEMFGLRVIRHRKFELSHPVEQPTHPKHRGRARASGRRSRGDYTTEGYYESVYGTGTDKGSTVAWQEAMGIDWTSSRRHLAEMIPPAYTEFIGRHLSARLAA